MPLQSEEHYLIERVLLRQPMRGTPKRRLGLNQDARTVEILSAEQLEPFPSAHNLIALTQNVANHIQLLPFSSYQTEVPEYVDDLPLKFGGPHSYRTERNAFLMKLAGQRQAWFNVLSSQELPHNTVGGHRSMRERGTDERLQHARLISK